MPQMEGSYVRFAVTDTGPGIPPEKQAKVFEPFQQADSTIRRSFGGSGLGLSISKHFVELHGGPTWLESRVHHGTTLFFTLPVEAATGTDTSASRWFSVHQEHEPRTAV